jgi:hypothetical protein
MRSPVSKEGIGESKAIKSRQSSHSELTFPSMLEAEFANKRAIVALVVESSPESKRHQGGCSASGF